MSWPLPGIKPSAYCSMVFRVLPTHLPVRSQRWSKLKNCSNDYVSTFSLLIFQLHILKHSCKVLVRGWWCWELVCDGQVSWTSTCCRLARRSSSTRMKRTSGRQWRRPARRDQAPPRGEHPSLTHTLVGWQGAARHHQEVSTSHSHRHGGYRARPGTPQALGGLWG